MDDIRRYNRTTYCRSKPKASMLTLDQVLETASQLPIDQQQMLIKILQSRNIESRREEIARDAQKSLADFKAGKLKAQSVDEIVAELRQSLDDSEE